MPTLEQLKEVHKRGLADKLPDNARMQYDEALRRGLIGDANGPLASANASINGASGDVAAKQDVNPIWAKMKEMVTGTERTTPEMEQLDEIGNAPELNEMSMSALKASFGLLATGDTEKAKGVISTQIPSATFKEDEKGNTIVNLPSGSYALNKPGISPQDIARLGFGMAAFSPAGKAATIPKEIGKRAAVGSGAAGATELGLQSATEQLGGGPVDAGEVALASAFGGGGQLVGDAVGAGIRALKGKIAEPAKQVIKAGEDAGVPVLTSDVLPSKNIVSNLLKQTGERIPFFGTGGIRAGQQEARERAIKELSEKVAPVLPKDIVDSLVSSANKFKKAAGQRLQSIKSQMDEAGSVPVENINKKIDDIATKLNAPGKIKDTATLDKLATIKQALNEAPQDFSSLRDMRTSIRELVETVDATGRSQLPSATKAQMDGLYKTITNELDNFVGANAGASTLTKYKKADAVYASEAQKLTKSKLKNVLDKADITPETVETMLFSNKPSEIKSLYDALGTEGRNASRAAILGRVLEKAEGNPTKFANEMKKIKESVGVFFKGKSGEDLRGLQNLLATTKRAQEAGVTTPTGQSLQVLLSAGAGGGAVASGMAIPTVTGVVTAGTLARIYESKPVRNMLLKLANTPPGSIKAEKIISEAMPEINAFVQTLRREEEK